MMYEAKLNEILNNQNLTYREKHSELRLLLSQMASDLQIPHIYSDEYREKHIAVIEVYESISNELGKYNDKYR